MADEDSKGPEAPRAEPTTASMGLAAEPETQAVGLGETLELNQGGAAARGAGSLAPGAIVGRYVVLGVLGTGGMSTLYTAYDPELGRKVALKFVRLGPAGAPAVGHQIAARLLREAQAIARIHHPAVITIHHVDRLGPQIYLAEELVDGEDLGRWLLSGRRSRREILALFAQAGEGLWAAHQAGIVHRDFKPQNVLVGRDGRVRVCDFGLARRTDEAAAEVEVGPTPAATPSGDPLGTSLTETGAVLGTPGYMAPEQHLGLPVDERADQFSFCVSLYEALYGERPFRGTTHNELALAATRGQVAEPPPGARVPAWLRAVLLRGLRVKPEERHASMGALLAALRNDPSVRRRRWLGAAALLGVGLGLLALGQRYLQARLGVCRGAAAQLAGVWDEGRKATIRKALVATGVPYAEAVAAGVARNLDAYAQAWVAMHEEACAATRLRGEQSEEALEARMSCLSERREAMRALGEVLEQADGKVVDKAVQAAGGLGSLAECADVRALLLPVRPPRDAAVRAQVEVLRGRLARAEALDQAGRYAQGLGVVEPLVAEAQRLGYMPLVAAALSRRGGLELRSGKTEAAAATLREAWLAALTAGDEGQAARIATVQAYALGAELSRPGEGEWWAREGQALLAHFGERPELAADLANSLGTIRERQGRLDEAAAEYRRAITLREKALGKDHPSLGQSLNNLGGILGAQGRHAEAIAIFERVLALRERTLGKEHPLIANALSNLGLAMADQGDYAGSQARLERCLAIREKALGHEHPRVGADHLNLGGLLYNEGRYPEALAHLQQADAILEKTLGQEHAHVGQCLSNRGLLLLAEGRLAEARVDLERSLAIAEKSLGKEHPNVAQSLLGLGVLHAAEGRPAEAFESYRRALALREKTLGKEHPAVAEALTERAQLERRSGQLGAARADIERALAIDGRPGEDPVPLAWARVVFGEILLAMGEEPRARELLTSGLAVLGARAPQPERMGEAQLALARALWSSAAERPRALDLAMQARAEYARLPGRARERAEVDAWLAAHRGH